MKQKFKEIIEVLYCLFEIKTKTVFKTFRLVYTFRSGHFLLLGGTAFKTSDNYGFEIMFLCFIFEFEFYKKDFFEKYILPDAGSTWKIL